MDNQNNALLYIVLLTWQVISIEGVITIEWLEMTIDLILQHLNAIISVGRWIQATSGIIWKHHLYKQQ